MVRALKTTRQNAGYDEKQVGLVGRILSASCHLLWSTIRFNRLLVRATPHSAWTLGVKRFDEYR